MTNAFDKPITIKETQAATQATFDILQALVLKNEFGWTCARAGWTIEMVFHEGDTLAVRERAWKVIDLFVDSVGAEKLAIWWGLAPVALDSKQGQARIAKHKPSTLNNPSGFAMMFNLASGKPKPPEQWENNAQNFRLRCRIGHTEDIEYTDRYVSPGVGPGMSFIRMALPVAWVAEQPPERGVGWLTSRAVELMQPFWCIAGWGVMPAVEERNIGPDGKGQQILYPYLQRFPGLNALGSLALHSHDFNNAMYSINWLSYVSDTLLDRLGGRETVRKLVKSSKYLCAGDVGNCLGIRAGDFPGLGDTERGLTLPAFGEAARLLKPLRVKSRLNNFVAPPPSGSNDEDTWRLACDAYLSRFDDY